MIYSFFLNLRGERLKLYIYRCVNHIPFLCLVQTPGHGEMVGHQVWCNRIRCESALWLDILVGHGSVVWWGLHADQGYRWQTLFSVERIQKFNSRNENTINCSRVGKLSCRKCEVQNGAAASTLQQCSKRMECDEGACVHLSAGSTYFLCGELCVVQRTAAYYEWITAAGQREGKLGARVSLVLWNVATSWVWKNAHLNKQASKKLLFSQKGFGEGIITRQTVFCQWNSSMAESTVRVWWWEVGCADYLQLHNQGSVPSSWK